MDQKSLDQWLRWQEQLHPREIDLGLTRCRQVFDRLFERPPAFLTVSVAGTNGKGSCAAFLEYYFRAAGFKTGLYSSPHLLRYNERIRIAGKDIDDSALCRAFQRVDDAREDTSLTYFEFGTLAAVDCFANDPVDIAIMEVGLGGRLDAVNLLDADVAVVTSIAMDHQEWLGEDRESIAAEKAGIFRAGKPAVCGDRDIPAALVSVADELGAPLYRLGMEFDIQTIDEHLSWSGATTQLADLPQPVHLFGTAQLGNIACAIMAAQALNPIASKPVNRDAVVQAFQHARLPGRFQVIKGVIKGGPEWVLDVAHNPAAARNLAECLEQRPAAGKTTLVLGMLSGKDVHGVVSELDPLIDAIVLCSLPGPRGLSAAELVAKIPGADDLNLLQAGSPRSGCELAATATGTGGRIVVTGSFLTVAAALELLNYPA